METAEATSKQRHDALRLAREATQARGNVKKRVLAGGPREGVLAHPDVATARVLDVLKWRPNWGRERARRLLLRSNIYEFKAVGSLTARQRALLEEEWL